MKKLLIFLIVSVIPIAAILFTASLLYIDRARILEDNRTQIEILTAEVNQVSTEIQEINAYIRLSIDLLQESAREAWILTDSEMVALYLQGIIGQAEGIRISAELLRVKVGRLRGK